jgi:DNA mismatch endonuclease, patch repair protein
MADVLTPEQRRLNMSRIRGRDTRPEMIVRSIVHRLGYRYALHRKDLPGKPDLVFTSRSKIIFVHGCFFHMHDCPYGRVVPKTNAEFWRKKRASNVERDNRNQHALITEGWQVLNVWECWTKPANIDKLPEILKTFLASSNTFKVRPD